jgi:adenine/guanine phosphoribosyltransferase-like PRPP-binding protein
MNKTRPAHDVAAMASVIGEVEGKIAILSDDIISTGGTLIAAAEALLDELSHLTAPGGAAALGVEAGGDELLARTRGAWRLLAVLPRRLGGARDLYVLRRV